ncbi:MAG: calcium/sodium antiporter [Gemmatimonadota bacterium]|nr:calcium/sodium antiporter [Gemmatimonadota bacterium]
MTYANLIAGLIYLLVGGDLLVRGAVAAARRGRIPPAIVAATVVALGTSIPELVVALRASLSGYPDLVLGNVVGSNAANVLLVAGVTAVLFPLAPGRGPLRRDALLMVGATAFFVAICAFGAIGSGAGFALLAALVLVWGVTARGAVQDYQAAEPVTIEWVLGLPSRVPMIVLFVGAGAVGLPLGARMVVDSAIEIAVRFGLSEAVVGLTIVALSTSLPELATTLVAGFQGRAGVAVGAILGSNVFNVLGIMGVAAVASAGPLEVPAGFMAFDVPVMVGASMVLAAFVVLRRPIGRRTGIILSLGYVAYISAVLLGGS